MSEVEELGHITYQIDKEGNVWVEVDWDNESDSFANMLFDLHSGAMLSDTLAFIKEQCNNKNISSSYQNLVFLLTNKYDSAIGQQEDTLVVRPTEVFPNNPF